MSPDDAQVVARDPLVPGLPIALDEERLRRVVTDRWCATDRSSPDDIEVRYLRYKPGTQLLADVRLRWGSEEQHALLIATAHTAAAKLAKQRRHAHDRGHPVLAEDPESLTIVVPAEADRHLLGCRRLGDRVGWLDRSLSGSSLHVLAYKPHRRLVARVDRDGAPVALLKVHHPSAAPRAIAALRWAADQRPSHVRLPNLRATDAETGTVLTSWTPGAALDRQRPERQRATLRSVGKLLGRMHQLGSNGLPDEASSSSTERIARGILRLRPDLHGPVHRALGARPATTARVPIHGDLSPDQVIHGDDGVTLIDLDRTELGSAAADLASWIAASLVTGDPATDAAELPAALWDGYRSVGGPAQQHDVAAQLPFQILRRASEPFRYRRRDWSTQLEALVGRSEQLSALVGAA